MVSRLYNNRQKLAIYNYKKFDNQIKTYFRACIFVIIKEKL